jgi:hypothetical protein
MANSVEIAEITGHPKRYRENTCRMPILIRTSQGTAAYPQKSPETRG